MDTETLPAAPPTQAANTPTGIQQPDLTAAIEIVKLQQQAAHGANWFFWIAGLSMVNSFLLLQETEIYFPAGLALVQIPAVFGAISDNSGILTLGLAFGVIVASLFVFFGVMGRKGLAWAFIAGLVLYGLDGLLFLIVHDIIAIGFHALGCFGIYRGLKATNEIAAARQPAPLAR